VPHFIHGYWDLLKIIFCENFANVYDSNLSPSLTEIHVKYAVYNDTYSVWGRVGRKGNSEL